MAAHTLVTIIFDQNILSFALFEHKNKLTKKIYTQTITLACAEIHQGHVYNLTSIMHYCRSFFRTAAVHNAPVAIAVHGDTLYQKVIPVAHGQSFEQQINAHIPLAHIWNYFLWQHRTTTNQYAYIFGIPREVLMQYQLLSHAAPFSCCSISTCIRALLAYDTTYDNDADDVLAILQTIQTAQSHTLSEISPITTPSLLEKIHTGLFILTRENI